MSHVKRPRIPGALIFFETALRDRSSDLLLREINLLRFAVACTLRDWPVTVEAWTVLPSQMMCIWRMPEDNSDYATRWRLIKSRFSRALPAGHRCPSHVARRERAIWQRRFWEHHIRDKADFEQHMARCFTAPADLGYVRRPDDWRYSSFYKMRHRAA